MPAYPATIRKRTWFGNRNCWRGNKGDQPSFEEELAQDIEIITVFSAGLYGRRSLKIKQLLNTLHNNDETGREDNPARAYDGPRDFRQDTKRSRLDSPQKAPTTQEAWLQAIRLYLDLMERRDAAGA